ncbi:hypothetical protein AOXY_G33674 [Acipenser oxyrinchus oxyrinchus]|uniref:Uncharacterized protein n=1 Tax=Acipenser oxyrinchus oxyrinchus TaxID=40147 RepID=A0AAD8CJ51_ACIOX|nr:hypothetical protein AOXY_G33674 [Acipenser oxyrinchus oxyrinchus]
MLGESSAPWLQILVIAAIVGKGLSDPEQLRSISDLQNKQPFGVQPPSHGYILLWWLCKSAMHTDSNNNAFLLNCNPRLNEYGFHRFDNRWDSSCLCYPLPNSLNVEYFAIGHLNNRSCLGSEHLDPAIRLYFDLDIHDESWHRNRSNERVIISLNQDDSVVRSIYITDHYHPDRTFEISQSLISDIRNLPLQSFMNLVGYDQPRDFVCRSNLYQDRRKGDVDDCNEMLRYNTELTISSWEGMPRVHWKNLPWNDSYGWIGLYKSSEAKNEEYVAWSWTNANPNNDVLISTRINPGMRARYFRSKEYNAVLASPQIHESCWKDPTPISTRPHLSLQLVFNDLGVSGVKLFVSKSYIGNWREGLESAWVGFYFQGKGSKEYQKYQYLSNFKRGTDLPEYEVYSDGYKGPYMSSDLEARLFCDSGYECFLVSTPHWTC